MEWLARERVVAELHKSKTVISRQRDLAVFELASAMCLSPHRRVMLMLRELHQMGFERLRGPSHDHNISWRFFIIPAAWTFKTHGHEFRDLRTPLAPIPSLRSNDMFDHRYIYGGVHRQRPFDWPDVPFASPRELAERFIRECPDIAIFGWGPDKEYVAWYERLLEATKPYELYNTSGACFGSNEHIFITMEKFFPLPPPGHTDQQEVERFVERFSPKSDDE